LFYKKNYNYAVEENNPHCVTIYIHSCNEPLSLQLAEYFPAAGDNLKEMIGF